MPNVGKSTLYNCLTKCSIPAENFPFCTIDPNSVRFLPLSYHAHNHGSAYKIIYRLAGNPRTPSSTDSTINPNRLQTRNTRAVHQIRIHACSISDPPNPDRRATCRPMLHPTLRAAGYTARSFDWTPAKGMVMTAPPPAIAPTDLRFLLLGILEFHDCGKNRSLDIRASLIPYPTSSKHLLRFYTSGKRYLRQHLRPTGIYA